MLRVISCTVISLFLCLPVSAQISGRLDSLRAYTLDQANVSASYTATVTSPRLTRIINRACAQVAMDFDAVEKLDTLYLVDSTDGVALNSDFLRAKAAHQVRYGDNAALASYHIQMKQIHPDSVLKDNPTTPNNQADPNDTTSIREFWTYGNRFFTHPAWGTDGDSVRVIVSYCANANRLDAATDSTLISREYREKIILYAVSLVKSLQGLHDESAVFLNRYYAGRGQEVR